ncbi:GPI ethanolamine phosphate transferase 2-like [Amphibalanus amphitrite]|uniref:GPI ethanolamine phosphate transferase 2-like n=1 Tax=Amphibalanus amphitrite TaxID=1232801 RepID=UPI001C92117D|nr:GPI ethanolamine phosphate transferase 2-like [Amphibalanus amphitrite]
MSRGRLKGLFIIRNEVMGSLLTNPTFSAFSYIIGCFIFMMGYFPTPRSIYSGNNSYNESVVLEGHSPKLVWMIIDALRADFTQDDGKVAFLDKMKNAGHVRSYVALVEPPTVTLPRVKALTTGTVPEFLDVLRNYDSGALSQDSLVQSLHAAGRRLVFYGDDTWLRLFPESFVRQEGTHSFFVNDYTEVDNNVTGHLAAELARDDWDVLILHYLGLDHIGHLAGPNSPLIGQKLSEMSDVMETLYRGIGRFSGPPPVLVVCGDHGMSEAGSHGGSSAPETQVALHFVSPLYAGQRQAEPGRRVRQLDLAPTLAALLGVAVPAESVGRVLEDAVLPLGRRRLAAALINTGRQLLRLSGNLPHAAASADVEAEILSRAEQLLSSEPGQDPEEAAERAAAAASGAVQRLQAKLLAGAAQHDPAAMVLGALLLVLTLVASCAAPGPVSAAALAAAVLGCAAALLLLCGLLPGGRLCAADGAAPALLLVGAGSLGVAHLCSAAGRLSRRHRLHDMWPHLSPLDWLLCGGCGLHLLSLGATSFIEEEHQTWYFFTTTLWLLLLWAELRRRPGAPRSASRRGWLCAAQLLTCGLLRRWNQTGDKWLHLPDIGDWLTAEGHRPWLAAVWAAGLLPLAVLLSVSGGGGGSGAGWAAAGALCLLLRGLADERLLGVARLPAAAGLWAAQAVYLLVLSGALWPSAGGRVARLRRSWLLLGALLVRPHNLAAWAGCALQSGVLLAWLDTLPAPAPLTAALTAHWTGMAAFFYMGNSNSLSSVDISAGYVGLTGHNSAVAVLLTASHTYAGPVLGLLTALQYGEKHRCFRAVLLALVTVRGLVLLVYCCLSAAFLHHIFVWTVFSPKLLYEAAWTAVVAAVAAVTSMAVRR